MARHPQADEKRKILIFAHVPPPYHGQSVMVQALLDGLRADPRFEVHHVDARVSDDLQDVGSFRPGKIVRLIKYLLQAWWIRRRHGPMAFYYVPAPAKRSAVIRDWVVMSLCRSLFTELILHWHAYGLGEWVSQGNDWQRRLTRRALGKANLSIVLNNYNKRDAEVFAPGRIEVVPNGIADLFPDYETALAPKRGARGAMLKALMGQGTMGNLEKVRFLFLGHLIESKGVFVAIEAITMANDELRKSNAPWRAHLTLAGSFASEADRIHVEMAIESANQACGDGGTVVELAGFLDSGQKKTALEEADCLVFPTFYEGETQGLVLLEAMSAGLPVITTSWRGVPEVLPEGYRWIVAPRSADQLARAMMAQLGDDDGVALRRRYEEFYTIAKHAELMADNLSTLP